MGRPPFAWGGLVVQPVVGVCESIGNIIRFSIISSIGVSSNSEGQGGTVLKCIFTNKGDATGNGKAGQ